MTASGGAFAPPDPREDWLRAVTLTKGRSGGAALAFRRLFGVSVFDILGSLLMSIGFPGE